MADYVRAELRDSGESAAAHPARSAIGAALHYDDGPWTARVEVRGAAEQDRVAAIERTTDGYTFLNASLGYRLFVGRT